MSSGRYRFLFWRILPHCMGVPHPDGLLGPPPLGCLNASVQGLCARVFPFTRV